MKTNTTPKYVGMSFLIVLVGLVLAALVVFDPIGILSNKQKFNGQRAYRDVEYQVSLGARTPGSQAHALTVDWISSELQSAGWSVETQETQMLEHPILNVIGRWGEGRPWYILGAHYDSRLVADRDPVVGNRSLPVPGANDGASGVAVLLELGRVLPDHLLTRDGLPRGKARQIWLVFFDAEDNGRLPGWDWILGSRAFVSELEATPDAVVIVDMIGDADLKLYQEKNSDPALTEEIWIRAAELGYEDIFIPKQRHRILDDHIPFLLAGIPAVDLIDFDYTYWHTTADTADKVSPTSLQVIGDTLLSWLTE